MNFISRNMGVIDDKHILDDMPNMDLLSKMYANSYWG